MSAPHQESIATLSGRLADGALSSRALIESLLSAIETDTTGAYVDLQAGQALADADAADAARAGGAGGALLGIPVAVKDVFNVKGQSCRCGSKILEGYTSPYDATAVARLREAGAVIVGRTNTDEFAMGSTCENSAIQVTRNPHDPERVPGGSSGGSAAAVAGGSAVAALGSDTGGSIRQPASFCGCVGLKPTYGRVSRYGLTAFASSLDQVGPLTRNVADAATVLQAIAGWDERDSTSLPEAVPDYAAALKGDLKGMTLGVPAEYFGEGIDPEVEGLVRAAIDRCRASGAELVEVNLPHTRYAIAAYYIIAPAEASANLARFDGIRYGARVDGSDPIDLYGKTREAGFGLEVKRRIILGTYALSSGYYDAFYLKATQVRTLIRRDFEEAFARCDALLAPVAPTAAYRIGEISDDPLKMYLGDACTIPVNLAGICGLSVPCGLTADKLPVGLQVIGPVLGEEAILRVGHAVEAGEAGS